MRTEQALGFRGFGQGYETTMTYPEKKRKWEAAFPFSDFWDLKNAIAAALFDKELTGRYASNNAGWSAGAGGGQGVFFLAGA
jgi:hypothetical protein